MLFPGHTVYSSVSGLNDRPNMISLVSPTEQCDAQLSGLQKAVEGQSDGHIVPLSSVLPLISWCCCVHHLYNVDVSATKYLLCLMTVMLANSFNTEKHM